MKKLIAVLSMAVLSAGCGLTQIRLKGEGDERLSCTEIAVQSKAVRSVLRSIEDKAGSSDREVTLEIPLLPALTFNQTGAAEAKKAATERLERLSELAKRKKCP
ncbi:MAG: hypothetical protein FJY42_06935 [Betaproteobacteria bacterium]|nr:hypothetical protein [Betaproteobacteria bacterium]